MQRSFGEGGKGLTMYVSCLAGKLLEGLGLGQFLRTLKVLGSGNPNWWFVGKPIESTDHAILDALFAVNAMSTPSLDAHRERLAAIVPTPARIADFTWEGYEVIADNRIEVQGFLEAAVVGLPAGTPSVCLAASDIVADAGHPRPAVVARENIALLPDYLESDNEAVSDVGSHRTPSHSPSGSPGRSFSPYFG